MTEQLEKKQLELTDEEIYVDEFSGVIQNGKYLAKVYCNEMANGIKIKQQILENQKIFNRLKTKIQNIKEQIEVAKREDYADIDDYCMKLRLEELEIIFGGGT